MSSSSSLIASKLTEASIKSLLNGTVLAIRIPSFLDKKTCKIVSEKLLSAKVIEEYTNAPGIGKVGIAFFETTGNVQMEQKYFESALHNLNMIRDIFAPYPVPTDSLRVQLDEVWPTGANLRVHGGRKMFAGLCRALENGQGIIPHEDKFERDSAQDPFNISFTENVQMAFNIYLQNPEHGGDLELYTQSLSTEAYDKLRGESYGIERSLLPKPALTIKPENGDLILFNSRNLHSVTPVSGKDPRLSISAFISRKDPDGSLIIWS
jgi:hypothetical protein